MSIKTFSKNLNIKKLLSVFIFSFVILFNSIFAPFSLYNNFTFANEETQSTPEPDINPISSYTIDIDYEAATVIEDNRGMRLYLNNHEEILPIPMNSKIMTAIIAIESLTSNTTITLSNVAARQEDAFLLSLRAGERYSLDYLLYGMLLRDNNAAAVALAEQVAGNQENFITQMNDRALAYGLENTRFANVSGQEDEGQYSTIVDSGRLIRYALSLPKFREIIQTKDRPFFLAENETRHLVSNYEIAWNLIGGLNGTYRSDYGEYSSFFSLVSGSSMNLIIVGVTKNQLTITQSLERITESIFDDYEVTTLVRSGQNFPKTIYLGEDSFGLKFNNTITYIRPRGTDFIKSTDYKENDIIEYPILPTNAVAKVTFEFLDGTFVSADLFPDTTIYGRLNYYNLLLSIYNENKTIGNMIIVLSSLLILLAFYKLIRLIVKFIIHIVRKPS